MSIEQAPAFQFYPRDFVGDMDVAAMTLEEAGAFAILLSYAWLKHGLPNDPARLARALHISGRKFDALWLMVGQKFSDQGDGRLRNARQEEERAKQRQRRENAGKRGRSGAKVRWSKHSPSINGECLVYPQAMLSDSSSSSSSSSSSKKKIHRASTECPDHDFLTFQAAYPKGPNVGTFKHAAKVWRRLSAEQRAAALAAIPAYAASDGATKDGGRFVPTPQKWLSDEWWLKPISAAPASHPPRPPSDADAYGWCQHEPRCGTREWHEMLLKRDARSA